MRCTTTTTATTARHVAPGRNRGVQGFQPNLMALSIAAAFLTACPWARAQPSGAQVVAGQASFHQQGGNLVVNTVNAPGTQHSTINWQSFNVPTGTSTWFNQPSATSTSINRVTAPNPSSILGNLGSNGHLVLVNPAGIAVGADAVVDTARFTAAAMQMTDADALGGRLRFEGGSEVSVWGRVLARTGDVVLLAPEVTVQPGALVQAANGAVMLAAGQTIELVSPGLEGLVFEVQAPTHSAVNLGTLQGNAVGMFARTLRHSGQVDVQAVTDEGGKVLLVAKDRADIDGQSRVKRLDKLGGSFHATAQTVNVGATATVDVSGEAGGGEILIGGGWQGQDDRLAHAQTTLVANGAELNASATGSGHGGTVVAWADNHTTFQGKALARGGEQGGDGGRVETSGKQTLDARGARVDTRAPQGKTGHWLLDPTALTIQGCEPPTTCSSSSFAPAATVYESDLENATSDVMLEAVDSIGVAGTFSGAAIGMGANHSLTLKTTGTSGTGNSIDLVAPGSIPIGITTSGTGGITLEAASGNIKIGDSAARSDISAGSSGISITAARGSIAVTNTSVSSTGAISVQGGGGVSSPSAVLLENSTVTGSGATVLVEAATPGSKLNIDANSSVLKSGAGSLILAADDLVIDGSVAETGGRVILKPATPSRPITVGAANTVPDHLNLSDSLLDNILSSNLEIGSRASTGGIHVVGPVTRPSPSTSSLSLLQGETGGVSQTSTGQIVVNALLAEGGFVNLIDSPNDVAVIAGKASNGFNFQSAHTPGFQVGVVNGVSGIEVGTDAARADLLLKSAGGDSAHITQGSGADIRAGRGEFISTGNVELMNDSNELSILKGNTGGSYRVTSHQAIGLDTISAGSSAGGSSVGNAAIGIRALSITGMVAPTSTHPAPALSATHGSVSLNATAGNIGSPSTPLRLGHVDLTVNAHAAGAGSSIDIIATHTGRTAAGDISADGNIELEGPGGTSTLDATRSMTSANGDLLIHNFLTTKLGRSSSDVIAARAIEVRSTLDPSSIEVRGTLRPGGQGRIGSRASVLQSTNVSFLAGSVLEFDMSDDAARDRINIMGAGTFNAASTIKMNLTGVNKDPVAADYTLISGAVTGTGGKSTVFPVFDRGNLAASRAATLKYSSLVLSISNATPPPPEPTEAEVLRELLAMLAPGAQTGLRLPLFSKLEGDSGSSSLGNVVYDDGRICR